MVSALWKACSQGDLQTVTEVLSTAEAVDIEIKDHTGITPLIEAVKNGHAEVVRALLDKGADPTNASSQGLPETYTADPTILGMLNFARQSQAPVSHENGYDTNGANTYPPPGNYPYYPSINSAPPPDMYYHPAHPHMHNVENNGARHNNLPPPEVASNIPCRYFPACRYGASCLFLHPTAPYFQGPLPPPAQYPTYDQMPPQSYAPTYYPVPQPSFPPPMNGQHPMPPPQQGPPMPMHGPSPPEMMSPPPQGHFSPNGAATIPYGPISPIMYSQPGQAPLPMSMSPLPPLNHQPLPPPASHSPQVTYNSLPPSASAATFVPAYPPVNGNGSGSYPEVNGAGAKSPQLNAQPEPSGHVREGSGPGRRGTARRGSFAGRKPAPACVFFPAGRCKNGTECRFPHVMPQEGAAVHAPVYPSRGGAPRRGGHANGNGFAAIDEKLANLSLENGRSPNDAAARPRGGPGGKAGFNAQPHKRMSVMKQRVPNADEFPVLGGSTTPPVRANGSSLPNGNGHAGPTAAQILQAPRPARSTSSQPITPRGVSPERVKEVKPDVNGTEAPKVPVSFASVATASDVSVAA
ncbi:hypothetical protein C8R47DRAFT_197461 [Mycena vitilis]|nr:hypothetical protein C8R47DRAFT_197461 [Mycena vitilis]